MGEGESVATDRPFHNMNAVERTRAKFRIWVRNCRGWRDERVENMMANRGICGPRKASFKQDSGVDRGQGSLVYYLAIVA